jgi:hypothetical protein
LGIPVVVTVKVTEEPSFTEVTFGAIAYVGLVDVSLITTSTLSATTGPLTDPVLSCIRKVSDPSVVRSARISRSMVPELLFTTTDPETTLSTKSEAFTAPETETVDQNSVVPSGTFVVDTEKATELPSFTEVVLADKKYRFTDEAIKPALRILYLDIANKYVRV